MIGHYFEGFTTDNETISGHTLYVNGELTIRTSEGDLLFGDFAFKKVTHRTDWEFYDSLTEEERTPPAEFEAEPEE